MATILPFPPRPRLPVGGPATVTVLVDGQPIAVEEVPAGWGLTFTVLNHRDGTGEATVVQGPATGPEDA